MPDHKIGIIGAGRLGSALALAFSNADHAVAISNSKGSDSLGLQVQIMLPKVTALDTTELVDWADIIILAVPLARYKQLPLSAMSGKIIIDAMNYWAPVDGKIAEFDAYAGSSSELVAKSIPGATLVKTLNSVAYGELAEHALPPSSPGRRAIPLSGDDKQARVIIMELIDSIGFDAADLGELSNGILFQPDSTLFNSRFTRDGIIKLYPLTSS